VIRNHYNNEAEDLPQYFEGTYIDRFKRNAQRRPPMFIQIELGIYVSSDA